MEQADRPALLDGFIFERVLSEDARTRTASLLGHFLVGRSQEAAVINIEKTHFSPSFYANLGGPYTSREGAEPSTGSSLVSVTSLGSNDVYTWLLGWMPAASHIKADGNSTGVSDPHVKLTVIRPATEAHILKYAEQPKIMVHETPGMYENVIVPYIASQPPERIQWVYNILDKKKEADTILYEDTDPKHGFIIVPDLKWDRRTLSSLYLVAIVHDRSLRSMRDLTQDHIPLLRTIGQKAAMIARDRFGLAFGSDAQQTPQSKTRCFLHYQPTYYHLHVHILSSDYSSHPGATVGQAHLLDDVIDLLELGVDFRQRTLAYALGTRSPLLPLIEAHEREHG